MRLPELPATPAGSSLPLWPPILATRGPGATSDSHAHHAMHIVMCVEGELCVRIGSGPPQRAAGVVTAPDVVHSIDAAGTEALLVFIDPESAVGVTLRSVLDTPVSLISAAARLELMHDARPQSLIGEAGAAWTWRVARVLGAGHGTPRPPIHPRVKQLLRLLRDMQPEADASLESLARAVGLSPGRLMHVFTESIGVPLRPYLQWLKLQRAAAAIVSGAALTEAAHAAGFADAAHMSRTFRRTLGVSPSALRGRR